MRIRSTPWFGFALVAAAVLAVTAGVDFYIHRFVRSDRDLFRFLPQRDATLFYLNMAALRHSGMIGMLAGAQLEEGEYREFVRQTRFDYTRDIDAVAGSADGNQIFFLVRGRFDWNRLRAYATAHGGTCTGGICNAPGSRAGRWTSFCSIQRDVLALALSTNALAAKALQPPGHSLAEALPPQPVWIRVSRKLLSDPATLPLAIRLFAISLQSANPVVLSLTSVDGDGDVPFRLELDAQCSNAAAADTIRNQLELDTKMLQLGLAREHAQRDPAGLSGLLTSGVFQVVDTRVVGRWPLRKALLKTLQ